MEIDKTTLNDLSVFNNEETFSLFEKLNLCLTVRGKEQLKKDLSTPKRTLKEIEDIQQTIIALKDAIPKWPGQVSNGTLMVMERFFETPIDPLPGKVTSFSAYSYKILHGPDYSLAKYSAIHFFDFIKGIKSLIQLLLNEESPFPLKKILSRAQKIITRNELAAIDKVQSASELANREQLQLAYFIRYLFKNSMLELISLYAQLDAWYGMAASVKKYNLVFPILEESSLPYIEAKKLYHILLADPVPYDVTLNKEKNFLFLTGANMAGKSTFIKSVGTAVFLAHAGMAVPAAEMKLSVFDGLLSNINVIDNIVKGESYFYNEVQRIKATLVKISNGRNWLILIDELFKGTNIQDAIKCSQAVIEGLLKVKNSVFILSTHLYEMGASLQNQPNIRFNYFETAVSEEQLEFSYQLKEGISNDKLGYLILKQEGVVKMLEDL